jgi:tyrosyl-tRNA synthetase
MDIEEQLRIISKGAAEIINIEDLKQKLVLAKNSNRQLTIKLGLDPTAPDIHLGHAVVLRKIKQLQDLGHRAVIIIGDFTGMVGDPTGKSKTRKQLTSEEVLKNARTYETQIFKILDREKTEVRFNSQWLSKLNFQEVMELGSKYTVARMLEREDFKKRFQNHESISIHEFFYPLMQAYDSIAIHADIELGGTDQRFNILMGRNLQKEYGQESQVALFMPLLEGIDGIEKMSKSLGNYIGINEDANTIYIKAMQIPDSLIVKYFELATDIHPDEVDVIKKELEKSGANPRDIKMKLSRELVRLYHGEDAALKAEEYFKTVFQKKDIPDNIPEFNVDPAKPFNAAELMESSGMCPSRSEAKRLILQGAVKINGEKLSHFTLDTISDGDVLQVGRNRFMRIRMSKNKADI